MGDLIDRDTLLHKSKTQYDWNDVVDVDDIKSAPTIDAVPRSEYERVCRERDAAIADIGNGCGCCKYLDNEENCSNRIAEKHSGKIKDCWEWRGVKEEQ